jgi:MFS family permease
MRTEGAPRSVTWAKAVAIATVAMVVAGTVLLIVAGHLVDSAHDQTNPWFGGLGLLAVFLALTGGLIAVRRPGNRIGWILLVSGFCYGGIQLASGYGQGIDYAGWRAFPAAWPFFWLFFWSWVPALGGVATLLPLLFPTGRLPSPRWRPVAVATLGSLAALAMLSAIEAVPNVKALMAGDTSQVPTPSSLVPWESAVMLVAGICLVMCVASLFFRFRHAVGDERQQLRWLAVGGVVLGLGIVGGVPDVWWAGLFTLAGFFVFVACIGVAILRFRLYDIDRIVSRVLGYAMVTAFLVAIYAGVVVGVGSALGRTDSPVLIAGATLAVAALFRPVRRRVQAAVDRRFFRRRYDADRTLAAFSAGLRDELDVEELRARLVGAIAQSVQPSATKLWLRSDGGSG